MHAGTQAITGTVWHSMNTRGSVVEQDTGRERVTHVGLTTAASSFALAHSSGGSVSRSAGTTYVATSASNSAREWKNLIAHCAMPPRLHVRRH